MKLHTVLQSTLKRSTILLIVKLKKGFYLFIENAYKGPREACKQNNGTLPGGHITQEEEISTIVTDLKRRKAPPQQFKSNTK